MASIRSQREGIDGTMLRQGKRETEYPVLQAVGVRFWKETSWKRVVNELGEFEAMDNGVKHFFIWFRTESIVSAN